MEGDVPALILLNRLIVILGRLDDLPLLKGEVDVLVIGRSIDDDVLDGVSLPQEVTPRASVARATRSIDFFISIYDL